MKGPAKILAIDGDTLIQSEVKDFLKGNGYEFIGEPFDKNTLNRLESLNPDLVLLDMEVSEKDSFDLIREIRKRTPSPIIAISEKKATADDLPPIIQSSF